MRSTVAKAIEARFKPGVIVQLTDFKVLTFGCYGTLIDKDSGIYTALRPLLNKGVTLSREEVLASFTQHESAQRSEALDLPYSRALTEVHRRLAKIWGVICSEDDHVLFGKSVPHWPVFADTPAALQYFKRYFKLAVLSNVDRENFAGSSRRLEVKFDAVFSAQDIGSYKPDPRNFEYMVHKLAKLGWSKQDLLHTAQSPSQDLASAAACGLAAAWIDRRRESIQAGAAVAANAGVRHDFRFTSLVDMVKAHQEQLRA